MFSKDTMKEEMVSGLKAAVANGVFQNCLHTFLLQVHSCWENVLSQPPKERLNPIID